MRGFVICVTIEKDAVLPLFIEALKEDTECLGHERPLIADGKASQRELHGGQSVSRTKFLSRGLSEKERFFV